MMTINPNAPLAVSFDMDETLIEKEPTGVLAFIDFCSQAGLPVNQEHFGDIERFRQKYFSNTTVVNEKIKAVGAKSFWREYNRLVLETVLGDSPDNEIIENVTVRFTREYRPRIFMLKDVRETLEALKLRNIPVGIITTRNTGTDLGINLGRVETELEALGILEHFSFIIGESPTGEAKPHPSVFLAAAQSLNVPVNRLLHVGNDYYADYEGAVSASAQAVLLDRHSLYPNLSHRIWKMDEILARWQ